MNIQNLVRKNYAIWYSVIVLVITWVISFALFTDPNLDTNSIVVMIPIAFAMFFPAILAFIFKRVEYKNTKRESQFSPKTLNKKSILFAIFYPIAFLFICTMIALALQIGEMEWSKVPKPGDILQIIVAILFNMIIVLGEEYGWRGYLLPELTKKHGKIKATVFVGIVWALFHIPVIYLSAKASGMSAPFIVCLIQALDVFVFSFSFSYCYYLSKNIIPVLLMHAVWNEINPLILGNVSSNTQGILKGNLLLMNGEGVLGLVIGAIMILWFVIQFRKEKVYDHLGN